MKKLANLLVWLFALSLLLSACGNKDPQGSVTPPSESLQTEAGGGPDLTKIKASYELYLAAKEFLVGQMMDAVSTSPEAGLAMVSLLRILPLDLALWPAAFLYEDEEDFRRGMGYIGAGDIELLRSDKESRVRYLASDGKQTVFTGTYSEDADYFLYTASYNGRAALYAECVKTDYGYAAQYYLLAGNGSAVHYLLSIEGEEGSIGFPVRQGFPQPLTGGENPDFPKGAPEWFSIHAGVFTGVTVDGQALEFPLP